MLLIDDKAHDPKPRQLIFVVVADIVLLTQENAVSQMESAKMQHFKERKINSDNETFAGSVNIIFGLNTFKTRTLRLCKN